MSASKEKQIRIEQRSEGLDKKLNDKLEHDAKHKKFMRRTVITIVVVIVVLALSILINSSYFYTKTTAVQVDDESYTAAEFNYYFRNSYYSFLNNYGSYVSLFLDTSTSLDQQQCAFLDDGTWSDYFTQSAENELKRVTALNKEAAANGYTLPESELTALEADISNLENTASSYGYTTNAYLANIYGKGMTTDYYRQVLTRYYTALQYGQTIYDGYTYTADELDEYYPTIADQYDRISYHVYQCSNSLDEYADMTDEEKAAAAHDAAAAIAEAKTEEEFSDKVYELLSDDAKESYTGVDYTLFTEYGSSLSTDYSEWLLDASRKTGDTYVADTDTGSYAVMFVARDDNHYTTANVRHILVKAEADENGEYTEEALAAAKARAEEILAEWEQDPTEDNFALLANEYSDDTGSNTSGGLYENVYKNQMVQEFNDFCFAGHQPGDTGIVYGQSSAYAGYHVIYYVGDGPIYSQYIAESVMRSNDYSAYETALTDGMTLTEKFSFRFTSRA